MTAPKVYGWCPGALRPMMSGDGLVVRVRAPLGRLTMNQAAGIAALSLKFGNGVLDVSTRANLQLRGVNEADHADLIDALDALGLVDKDVRNESQRNVIVEPFWTTGDDTYTIAKALTERLANDAALQLPGKFGFAVDCGEVPVLRGASADIRIERGPTGLLVRADGADVGMASDASTAVDQAIALAHWFVKTGGVRQGRGRMAAHIARHGPPQGHDLPARPGQPSPKPSVTAEGALVAFEFGQIKAEAFGELAALGDLRLTPWRMVLIEGLETMPTCEGIIVDPGDATLGVSACTGKPGCPQALSETRDFARKIAPLYPQGLHVSGCAKGCAHPKPSALTLTATGPGKFDLIRNGRAGDTPVRVGLSANDILNGEL